MLKFVSFVVGGGGFFCFVLIERHREGRNGGRGKGINFYLQMPNAQNS